MRDTIDYPSELDEHVTLPNQRHVHLRALRRCEEDPIRELDAHVSVQTRYFRFLSPFPQLPDSVVRLLACVDYRRTLALVVEDDDAPHEVVGLGSFGAVDDRHAEVALLVRDDWQRQRVGSELAERVLRAAEGRGFDQFIVHLHSDNVAIRKLLQRVGRVVSSKASAGLLEVAFVRQQPH